MQAKWSPTIINWEEPKGAWLRNKRWNHYFFVSPQHLFLVAVVNLDYVGVVFYYHLDLETGKLYERTYRIPFAKQFYLGTEVFDRTVVKNQKFSLEIETTSNMTELLFHDYRNEVQADFKIRNDDQSLNVFIPWSSKQYHLTSKQAGMRSSGNLKIGDKNYLFSQDNTLGFYDYGRGIWPYEKSWNWLTSAAITNEGTIGINLGAKWTDGTGITENGIIINGKAVKLSEEVKFIYNSDQPKQPWKIESEKVQLTFEPKWLRLEQTNFFILKSSLNQWIGELYGTVEDNEGNKYDFPRSTALCEDHFARW